MLGLPKRATLEILRYPKQASDNILESWDFCDPNDRKEVLKALFALKLQVTTRGSVLKALFARQKKKLS